MPSARRDARAMLPAVIVLTLGLCLGTLTGGEAHGQAATTLQLPEFGVAIDAEGVVSRRAVEDPGGQRGAGGRRGCGRSHSWVSTRRCVAGRRPASDPMPSSGTSPD